MKVLFAHNNFPAQFRNLASALASRPEHDVKAIGALNAPGLAGVEVHRYRPPARQISQAHPFARHFEMECRRAEHVMFAASALAASGYRPDLIFAHCGWGENLPLRSLFPASTLAIYSEFYFRADNEDLKCDPEAPRLDPDGAIRLQCRNAATLLALAESDLGISPTHWQRSTYPKELQAKIRIAHEGIDVDRASPNPNAAFTTPSGVTLRKGDEVVTYVSRNLERPRGYHVFMRALPKVLRRRPNAHVLIVGHDQASYGPEAPAGTSWKEIFLQENAAALDLTRVHFLGRLQHQDYLTVLQVSSAHVYLTYPFVLSWSLLEAMSVGCRIVASDSPPVREVIDEDSGVLTPFYGWDELADAVTDVLRRPAAYDSKAAHARASVVNRFDRRRCVPRLMRLLGVA
jgi:glycosyltransferase involved in cell wall biosynthesis